jgi:hypothetical protein
LGTNNGKETTPYHKYGGNVSCSKETPHKGKIENVDRLVLGAWIEHMQLDQIVTSDWDYLFGVVVGWDGLI